MPDRNTELQTHIFVTADQDSRYVFRADVNFDFTIKMKLLEDDTQTYHEDHLYEYAKKNARLRISHWPQPPTNNDHESMDDYKSALVQLENRRKRFDGLHTDKGYTAIAHFWLLKHMINAKEWRFVTDEDNTFLSTIYRVFEKEISDGYAHHLLKKTDTTKTRKERLIEYYKGNPDDELLQMIVRYLRSGSSSGYRAANEAAHTYLRREIEKSLCYASTPYPAEVNQTLGLSPSTSSHERTYMNKPPTLVTHPIPTRDTGYSQVGITTDVNNLSVDDLIKMFLKTNTRATDAFFQAIHRNINILERPLVGAQDGSKSYIYANLNPRYAQYAVTFLRTYYNFCKPMNLGGKGYKTPAQFLGIADKKYSLDDILYFR